MLLCDTLIKASKNKDNETLLVVPFSGSGSECVSAKQNNINFIGFEINEGVYYINFEIKILENILFYEKVGLKIHYPYEIIYNYF